MMTNKKSNKSKQQTQPFIFTNKKDLMYSGFHHEYDRAYDCERHGCDGICRCSQIYDCKITHFEIYEAKSFASKFGLTDSIDIYCLERYLNLKIKKKEIDFDFDIIGGYYGEELDAIYMDSDSINKLEIYIDFLKAEQDDTKKLNHLLILEYDFLLPRLENKSVSIQTIKINDINIRNERRKKEARTDLYYLPVEVNIPICVCVLENNKYNLIDGYTRIKSYNNTNKIDSISRKTIKAIIYS